MATVKNRETVREWTARESEIKYERGTPEPRENTRRCEHCGLHVLPTECGASADEAGSFAAATCALPCVFKDEGK